MVVFSRKEMEAARRERMCLVRFHFVARPEIERARDHREALVLGMPVWRNPVAGWDHEANDERPRFGRIALQDGDPRAFGHRWRCSAPFDVLGVNKALRFARALSDCGARKTPQNDRHPRYGASRLA